MRVACSIFCQPYMTNSAAALTPTGTIPHTLIATAFAHACNRSLPPPTSYPLFLPPPPHAHPQMPHTLCSLLPGRSLPRCAHLSHPLPAARKRTARGRGRQRQAEPHAPGSAHEWLCDAPDRAHARLRARGFQVCIALDECAPCGWRTLAEWRQGVVCPSTTTKAGRVATGLSDLTLVTCPPTTPLVPRSGRTCRSCTASAAWRACPRCSCCQTARSPMTASWRM